METTRQLKISRLLQKDLSEIFRIMAQDIFSGNLITVTKVLVSPDLSVAKAYLSLFGGTEKKILLKEINLNKKDIRHKLAIRVHNQLRVVPELEFFIDDSLDYIENIDRLLNDK